MTKILVRGAFREYANASKMGTNFWEMDLFLSSERMERHPLRWVQTKGLL